MACRGGSVDNPGETKWKINQLIKLSCEYKHSIGMLKFYFQLDNRIWRKKIRAERENAKLARN